MAALLLFITVNLLLETLCTTTKLAILFKQNEMNGNRFKRNISQIMRLIYEREIL